MANTLESRQAEYKQYIDEHIANVKKVFNRYGQELCDRLLIDHSRLRDMINDHDESKYSEDEFEGFRCYYYPTDEEEADKDGRYYRKKKYEQAWLHHLRNNGHHPEFWIYLDENKNPRLHAMDPLHLAEMLLDWAAMGIKFKRTAYDYWKDNIHTKPLHPDSIAMVDKCIEMFQDKLWED